MILNSTSQGDQACDSIIISKSYSNLENEKDYVNMHIMEDYEII